MDTNHFFISTKVMYIQTNEIRYPNLNVKIHAPQLAAMTSLFSAYANRVANT